MINLRRQFPCIVFLAALFALTDVFDKEKDTTYVTDLSLLWKSQTCFTNTDYILMQCYYRGMGFTSGTDGGNQCSYY